MTKYQSMPIDRFEKLPKFAREKINSLQRECDRLREEIDTLTNSAVPSKIRWGWKHSEHSAYGYLNDNETIFFNIGQNKNNSDIRIRLTDEGDGIQINGDRQVVLTFEAANSFKVKMGR